MNKIAMARGARTVAETCIGVKENEQVLIVTEPEKLPIAETVAAAVCAAKAEPVMMVMQPRQRDGQEPPHAVAEAMKGSTAFIAVVGRSITHTHAVKEACQNGSRGVVLTQFREDMMVHGGLEADFPAVAPTCKAIAKALAGAEKVHLSTPYGTDLTFSAAGRRGNAMYCMVEPGEFSPVPTVEANVSPLEGTAQGVIVADASIPYIGIGLLEEPVRCRVEDGRIVSISGGRQAQMLEKDLKEKNDANVYNVAELGVGLNPCCRFIGFMLEDEGVRGSVHIGIGTNITLGGHLKAACHYDLIMTKPTLTADGVTLLQDGEICIE
ncbi:aminopeptidase [Acidaminobacterium chupaoyuni]